LDEQLMIANHVTRFYFLSQLYERLRIIDGT
jgi:hypothetical protein